MDRQLQQTIKQINELVNLLDAKINAVAAYVASMPGASEVDVQNVKSILTTQQFTPRPLSGVPSTMSGVNAILSGISQAAAQKTKSDDSNSE